MPSNADIDPDGRRQDADWFPQTGISGPTRRTEELPGSLGTSRPLDQESDRQASCPPNVFMQGQTVEDTPGGDRSPGGPSEIVDEFVIAADRSRAVQYVEHIVGERRYLAYV